MKYNFFSKTVVFVIVSLILSSCIRRSYVFSPSLNLGEKQMEAGEISLGLNGALLPETSPENSANGQWVAPGGAVNLKLGITDFLEINAETWADLSPDDPFSRGFSAFSLVYKLGKEKSDWNFLLIPKYGFAHFHHTPGPVSTLNFSGIKGHGFSLSLAARKNTKGKIKPYFGLSGIMGFADWQANKEINSNGNFRNKNGQALVLHGGVNMKLNDYLSFNTEVPLIFQFDQFNEKYYIFPTINVGLSANLGKLWNK